MHDETIIATSCKDSPTFLSRLKRLLPTSSRPPQQITSKAPARLANAATVLLVTASTGLGCYYAWASGAHHGWLLASLFVSFAAGLELAKPLAVSAALAAFRSWSFFRGAALAMLAFVAIAYSLTAELTLMSTSRADVVAQREAAVRTTADAELAARRATERYNRATAELTTLSATRPAAEVQAEIDSLLLRPGANVCVVIDGRVTKEVCPKVAELRTEKARAERRAELEKVLGEPLPKVAPATGVPAISKGDPAASALSAYLAALGILVSPALLSEWLVLVPVLALEIGSAFSVLLVQAVAVPAGVGATQLVHAASVRKESVVQPAIREPVVQGGPPTKTVETEAEVQAREKVKTAIVSQLKQRGGSVRGGERGLAKLIGTNRSTMKRAINGLVMAGVIAAEATRNGTLLRLAT